jgi:succinate dehydrogenase (ubiquinone) flavoprotein subunit
MYISIEVKIRHESDI